MCVVARKLTTIFWPDKISRLFFRVLVLYSKDIYSKGYVKNNYIYSITEKYTAEDFHGSKTKIHAGNVDPLCVTLYNYGCVLSSIGLGYLESLSLRQV